MTEEILSYLWRFQKYNHRNLETTDGKPLSIYYPGFLNTNAGPDFSEAKISIDNIEWYGNIELHVNSSDWHKHGHSEDTAYQNVILHVVWNHDAEIKLRDYTLPVLELKGKVPYPVVESAITLLKNFGDIPCEGIYNHWGSPHAHSAFESAAIDRLSRKCNEVQEELDRVNGDWEEAFFRKFSSNLGFKINKDTFYELAKTVSHKQVMKSGFNKLRLEALLMGVAGFLNIGIHDLHYATLKNEFGFLKKKYGVAEMKNPEWKFLRMRPANFPTNRLSQLAALYSYHPHLFRETIDSKTIKDLRFILKKRANPYWEDHYLFGQKSAKRNTELGNSAIDLIIINTVTPFLFSYGKLLGQDEYVEKAMMFLQAIKPEENRITKKWNQTGARFNSALETQGAIELFEKSCRNRKCMQCKIGIQLLSEVADCEFN